MVRVLVAGLVTMDFVFYVSEMPVSAEKHKAQDATMIGGGGAANAAVSIARLGGSASLAAQIGDDGVGEIILRDLEAEGVDTAFVQRSPDGQSAFSSVLVDAAGERQIVNFRGSGLSAYPDLNTAPPCDAVLVDTRFPVLTRSALAFARKHGIPGVVDAEHPIVLDDLDDATHIAFSAQGLTGLTGIDDLETALRTVGERISAWLCVTDGANGVLYRQGDALKAMPVAEIEPVDTLAAGDVWHGAFTLRLAEGRDEETATAFANAAATLKCTKPGGRTGCPDRKATESFIRKGLRIVS